MESSSRVGYDCGEHDYDRPFAHHLRYRGDVVEYDGWGDDFAVDGYFPTAAEREAAAGRQRADAMLTPAELTAERQQLMDAMAAKYEVADVGDPSPGSGHYEFWRKGVL